MGVESIRSSGGPQSLAQLGGTQRGSGQRMQADGLGGSVRLSEQGRKLSRLANRMDPTREHLDKLSDALAGQLRQELARGGVDPRSAIAFAVDAQTGKVTVGGNRPDAQKLSALLAGQPELQRQIQDIATLSRQVAVQGDDARPDRNGRWAQNAARLSAFAADFASRFGNAGAPDDFSRITGTQANAADLRRGIATYSTVSAAANTVSLVYDGTGVRVNS